MQQLQVCKSGLNRFDFCHAAGLAVLTSVAFDGEVKLEEQGSSYWLSILPAQPTTIHFEELFEQILTLPKDSQDKNESSANHVAWSNYDGLLATSFTTRGIRLISVADGWNKEIMHPGTISDGLEKAKQVVERLKKLIRRIAKDPAKWLYELLINYYPGTANAPYPVPSNSYDVSIPMPIEPYMAFATRRPISDGLISYRKNVAVHTPPYAVLLAYIGAARFLRGQNVADRAANLYLPLYSSLQVHRNIVVPNVKTKNRQK